MSNNNECLIPLDGDLTDLTDSIASHTGDKIVVYKVVRGEALRIAFYLPEDFSLNKKYPALLCVHGGGWMGRKIFEDQSEWAGDYLGFLARHFTKFGFVGISIDYRLMQDNGQPDGYQLIDLYDDCVDACTYIYDHRSEYGIDEHNITLIGESAGGYLAAALATFPFKRLPFAFKKTILVNAITNLYDNWNKRSPLKSGHPSLAGLDSGEIAKQLSPLEHITPKLSPVILLHGEKDNCVSLEQSRLFHKKALAAGVDSRLYVLPGTDHAFLLAEYTHQQLANRSSVRFLEKEIGGAK